MLSLSLLSIQLIVIVTIFLVWPSTANYSKGQEETASIKITSPTNGQNISTGSNLTISGIATGNNATSTSTGNNNDGKRCYVSVIVNNVKPYQNATASGPKGVNDYSKWYYIVSTRYGAINEGQNKLTAKLLCLQATSTNTNSTANDMIKWYSVNVTGVSTSTSTSTSPTVKGNNQTMTNSTMNNPQQGQQQKHHQSKLQLNTTANTNSTTTALHSNSPSKPTSPSTATQNNGKEAATSGGNVTRLTQSPSNYTTNQPKPLSLSIQSSQNIVNGKGASTMTGTAYDAATGKKIDNATVKLKITFTSNGTSKEIVGHKGAISYSVEIKPNSKNSFRTSVQASAPGYISTSKTAASSSSNSSSNSTSISNVTSNSNHQESIIGNSGTDTLGK